jgi:RNA polymerase subunit RPABC4/transcription elongation factor Spt4
MMRYKLDELKDAGHCKYLYQPHINCAMCKKRDFTAEGNVHGRLVILDNEVIEVGNGEWVYIPGNHTRCYDLLQLLGPQ